MLAYCGRPRSVTFCDRFPYIVHAMRGKRSQKAARSGSPSLRRSLVRQAPRRASLTETEESAAPAEPIVVPYTELSQDALRGVLESFVLREGTEYGERDVSLDQKVAQVTRQLQRGEAQIVFDPETESIDVVVVVRGGRMAGPSGDKL